jgi:putative hemolysin
MALVSNLKNSAQLRLKRVHKFKAKIEMFIEMGPYIVKTAQSPKELIESFKLRHEVFNQEFREIEGPGLDFDRYDYFFDHLIIIHKESNAIIGTYRLNCSKFSKESYTALEFDLQFLKKFHEPYLELGRACIKKEYRKGAVISLLWRGIAEYMKLSGSNILFGCSSLKINNARDAALVYKYLFDQKHVFSEYTSSPTKNFKFDNFESWFFFYRNGLNELQIEEAEQLVPSLLKSYLKLGAKIAAIPAFDKDFDCVDLLTVLKKDDLSKSLADKFKINR